MPTEDTRKYIVDVSVLLRGHVKVDAKTLEDARKRVQTLTEALTTDGFVAMVDLDEAPDVVIGLSSYTCFLCGETFAKGWSDTEAFDEYRREFPGHELGEAVLVCDPCFAGLSNATTPDHG
jgi:hypothetical protein